MVFWWYILNQHKINNLSDVQSFIILLEENYDKINNMQHRGYFYAQNIFQNEFWLLDSYINFN